ncbi:hypothetical protein [Mucilaginibacter sp. dw_454]|uniref:hypothetical protein n=1 Tax=Mucilaginibacter sp. dw_454 TaxID=2720079 RepID=UPI001BD66CEF|nr:hypothetical protein [Mucilaginibacter sp. dw_454]
MKKYLFMLILGFTTIAASAQKHKLTIYSRANSSNCTVDYTDYDKLYPDSIKSIVMIDYKKKYQLKNINTLLLRMNLDGWKLVSTIADANGAFGNVYTVTQYLMSKEILLDDAAMMLYIQNLKSLK